MLPLGDHPSPRQSSPFSFFFIIKLFSSPFRAFQKFLVLPCLSTVRQDRYRHLLHSFIPVSMKKPWTLPPFPFRSSQGLWRQALAAALATLVLLIALSSLFPRSAPLFLLAGSRPFPSAMTKNPSVSIKFFFFCLTIGSARCLFHPPPSNRF